MGTGSFVVAKKNAGTPLTNLPPPPPPPHPHTPTPPFQTHDQPAPASKTEKSVSLGAGRKRLPLCGIQFSGEAEADLSLVAADTSVLPLNVVVDVESEASVSAAAAALRGLSEQQLEEVFLTLVLDAHELGHAVDLADKALARLGRCTADLVLLDWSKVVDAERQAPSRRESGSDETLWESAAKRILESLADNGKRRARALGLANAGLADVEKALALAEAVPATATAAAPRPAALAVELHPLLPQRKLVGVCRRKGVAMIALNPAGEGGGSEEACPKTRALLGNTAVAAAAVAESKSPREVRCSLFMRVDAYRIALLIRARISRARISKRGRRHNERRRCRSCYRHRNNQKKRGVKKQFF